MDVIRWIVSSPPPKMVEVLTSNTCDWTYLALVKSPLLCEASEVTLRRVCSSSFWNDILQQQCFQQGSLCPFPWSLLSCLAMLVSYPTLRSHWLLADGPIISGKALRHILLQIWSNSIWVPFRLLKFLLNSNESLLVVSSPCSVWENTWPTILFLVLIYLPVSCQSALTLKASQGLNFSILFQIKSVPLQKTF